VGTFDFDLRYRRGPDDEDQDDAGPVLMPKLFRRQCAWAVNKRAKMVKGSFRTYLGKKRDLCYLIDEFLEQGATAATPRNLSDFIGAGSALLARPQSPGGKVMAAYLIVDIDIRDAAGLEEYRNRIPGTLAKYGGRFIVRGGKFEKLEGDWEPRRLVVLEFPSVKQAKEWYDSEEYRP